MNFTKNKLSLKWHFMLVLVAAFTACKSINSASTTSSSKHPEEKLGWKLGTQAYTFNRFTFFQAVAKADSCNLSYIEAYPGQEIGGGIPGKMDYNMDAATRKLILEKLKTHGVKFAAFGVVGANNEADWTKIFEFCKAMGAETITTEPDEKDMQLLSDLADKYGINVAIHNHPDPSHYWNPDIVLNAIKGKSNKLGMCADIGHWIRSGLDPIACLKKSSGHVLHLHMKDLNEKSKDGHDVHWGEGVANVAGIIQELKAQKFKGVISAEYEYNWDNNSADVAASVKNFRELFVKP